MRPKLMEVRQAPGGGRVLAVRGRAVPAWWLQANSGRGRNGRVHKVRLAAERGSARKGADMARSIAVRVAELEAELAKLRAIKPARVQTEAQVAAAAAYMQRKHKCDVQGCERVAHGYRTLKRLTEHKLVVHGVKA